MVGLSSSAKEVFDQLAKKISDEKKLPNYAFGVTSVEKELYFNAGGYHVANDPTSGEVDPDSVFWICSQTKLITHLAALHLIEQGKITPESLVSDYIPELANPVVVDDQFAETWTYKPAQTKITIKHLLNFSSGLFYPAIPNVPEDLVGAYCASYSKENGLSEFFSNIKGDLPGVPILFEPGESFAYGWNSDVLGFVIEKASGLTLEQYLYGTFDNMGLNQLTDVAISQDNIFKPLGVKASFYLTPDLKEKLIDLSYRKDGKLEASAHRAPRKVIEQDPSKVSLHLGGVGIYTSLRGYLTILRHILQIEAGSAEKPILSRQAVRSLFEGTLTDAGSNVITGIARFVDPFAFEDKIQWSTGLAVCTSDWPNRRRKGTASWGGWANTNYFIDPTAGVAAVFGTQLVPPFDRDLLTYNTEFEVALYAGLTE